MALQCWKKFGLAAVATAILLLPSHANATTLVYSLTVDGCTGGCGAGPYGTIVLDDSEGSNIVDLTVTLTSGYGFVATGAGDALEFNILGNPAITINDITAGFAVGPAPDSASTFGKFMYSVTCTVPTGCGNGGSIPNPGPLSFDVVLSGVTLSSFTANSGGYFFASDVGAPNLNTGNVAALGPGIDPPSVPEPASLTLFGTGLALLAAKLRRKAA
jgi:hypothetical protein